MLLLEFIINLPSCQSFSINNYMPRLSLYRPNKENDYRFMDRTISEQLSVGGTDLYIHKYLGIADQGPSTDYTQPQYTTPDPTQIQDLLFLENRDRKYDTSIYRLRGHYNVQNLDFDLSQFGLFLNNDIIFITVHYNDMIDIIGRKLMAGDVLELPHLVDYNPLNEQLPIALKRYMQITDANYASEGFSQTWYPHLWRIKCEKLVNTQEFKDILQAPVNQDNYLGDFNPNKTYPAGYTITYGGKVYKSLIDVPAGITPPNATYWGAVENGSIADIISTYNKNLSINDAALNEAERIVPKSGYDTSKFYVMPTYGKYQANGKLALTQENKPAPPININVNPNNTPGNTNLSGTVMMVRNPRFRNNAAGLRISKKVLENIWDITADTVAETFNKFTYTTLNILELDPVKMDTGSGPVEKTRILQIESLGEATSPYGTADNTYATADQDPTQPNFSGDITINMDFRADCIPGFQFIARSTPRSFGYSAGYGSGDGTPPNGIPLNENGAYGASGAGITFPPNPQVGDYFLRIDYLPQILYRWDGVRWVRISTNVRTETGFADTTNQSQLNSFINDPNTIYLNNEGKRVSELQPLSQILTLKPDSLPPE